MNKLLLLSLIGTSTLAAGALSAAWTEVDTFQDQDVSDWTITYNEAEADPQNPPSLTVIQDPVRAQINGQDNYVLSVFPGKLVEGVVNSWSSKALPEPLTVPLDPGTHLNTLFFEIARPIVNVGGSDVPAELDTVYGLTPNNTPGAYGDYSVMARWQKDGHMDVRDAGSYIKIGQDSYGTMTWYKFWFVIDHSVSQDLQASNKFKIYVQGGEYATQTLIYPATGDGTDESTWAGYRNDTLDDLTRFLIATSTGSIANGAAGRDPTYFDNIFEDTTGMNLSIPDAANDGGAEMWAEWTVMDNGGVKTVDTGSFMGTLFVNYADSGWVYSYNLGAWIYLPQEWVTAQGSWVWVAR